MAKNQNNTKSSGAQITSSLLLSLSNESIHHMVENLRVEDLCAVEKIGQQLRKCAVAKLEEKFQDYYVTVDGYYADFAIKEEYLKKFASYIRNITIKRMGYHNGKEIAKFIESNFSKLKRIELKFVSISHHLKNIFKNVDTIIFDTCQSDTGFCYHDDCLRHCERLRCLRFCHYGTSEDEEDKFNAIMRQKYSGLENVQFDMSYTPNMLNNWERFIQQNTNIKSLTLRFLNENERLVLKVMKPIADYGINLEQLFLHLDFDERYHDVFNFGIIHEQLMILDRREHFEHLGIYCEQSYIKNLNLAVSLKSLKMLDINHSDPCTTLPEISKYSNMKVLGWKSFESTCRLGDHQMLEKNWNYHFSNLEELHFWKVTNAYFLIPFFIRGSPKLKKIIARGCEIVLENSIQISMKKFNDERSKVSSSGEELIIYSNQPNIQSNYQFNLVKLKHVDFVEIPFNEFYPFECYIEDKIGLDVFNIDEINLGKKRMTL